MVIRFEVVMLPLNEVPNIENYGQPLKVDDKKLAAQLRKTSWNN
jgi:hypothetical protein